MVSRDYVAADFAVASLNDRRNQTVNSEYWFGQLADSLKNGFFADSVVLELARVLNTKTVNDDQKILFREALKILQFATEGSKWIDDPKMSERASTCAGFFGQAVEAMTPSFRLTPQAFAKGIENLTVSARLLAGGEVPSDSQLNELRTFFFNAGRTELEKTESLMSGDQDTDKLRWLAAR